MNPAGKPTVLRQNVGTCPACHDYLWADVDVLTLVSEPSLNGEGQVKVYATPKLLGMRLTHECQSEDGGMGDVLKAMFEDRTTT